MNNVDFIFYDLIKSCSSFSFELSSCKIICLQEDFDTFLNSIHVVVSNHLHNIKKYYSEIIDLNIGLLFPFDSEIQRKKDRFVNFNSNMPSVKWDIPLLLDHIVLNIIEECGEVNQRITKCMRFGYDNVQLGQNLDNLTRLRKEYADLIASCEMLDNLKEIFNILGEKLLQNEISKINESQENNGHNGEYLDYIYEVSMIPFIKNLKIDWEYLDKL